MTDWARWRTASVYDFDDRDRDDLIVEAIDRSLRASSTVGP